MRFVSLYRPRCCGRAAGSHAIGPYDTYDSSTGRGEQVLRACGWNCAALRSLEFDARERSLSLKHLYTPEGFAPNRNFLELFSALRDQAWRAGKK